MNDRYFIISTSKHYCYDLTRFKKHNLINITDILVLDYYNNVCKNILINLNTSYRIEYLFNI